MRMKKPMANKMTNNISRMAALMGSAQTSLEQLTQAAQEANQRHESVLQSYAELETAYNALNRSYKVSVGWTTKYRNALAEANSRLAQAGAPAVKVFGSEEEYKAYQAELF